MRKTSAIFGLDGQEGFTLVELMIALTLGVLLSFGLIQVLMSSKSLSSSETGLSRVQEAGRFAADVIGNDLRMVGYVGCPDPKKASVKMVAKTGVDNFPQNSLEGYEVDSDGDFSPVVASGNDLENIQPSTSTGVIKARKGSDVIRIKYAENSGAELAANSYGGSVTLSFNGNPACYDLNDLVLVSSCAEAHLFRNTNDTCKNDGTPNVVGGKVTFGLATSDNKVVDFYPGYIAGEANLLGYVDVTYFVADTGRNTEAGADIYALYRRVNGKASEELVEGVEYLQLEYVESLGSGKVRNVSADDASLNMAGVNAVRIGLLVQTLDAVLAENDTKSYVLPGGDISSTSAVAHGSGKYLRKAFVTTVSLPNRRG